MMNQQRTTGSTPTALLTFTQSTNVLIYNFAIKSAKLNTNKSNKQATN
jgi:hypothetical protein